MYSCPTVVYLLMHFVYFVSALNNALTTIIVYIVEGILKA